MLVEGLGVLLTLHGHTYIHNCMHASNAAMLSGADIKQKAKYVYRC